MEILLVSLHVIVCVFLIIVVLLQPGKGGDLGSAFGGGTQQNIFGARGAVKVLSKITTVSAVIFMLTSIGLATVSSTTKIESVMKDVEIEPKAEPGQPANDATAPTQPTEIDASMPNTNDPATPNGTQGTSAGNTAPSAPATGPEDPQGNAEPQLDIAPTDEQPVEKPIEPPSGE